MTIVVYVCACGNAVTLNTLRAYHKGDLPGNVQLKFTEVRCSALHHAMDKPEMRRVEVEL